MASALFMAAAQATGPADAVPMQSRLVKTGLYLISGGGGNSLVRFSAEGLVLVNAKQPGAYEGLMAQVHHINKMSDLPMRVVIVTDHRPAEAGNVAQFLASGVPVIAQAESGLAGLAHSANAASVIGFDADYTVKTGGVEIRLMHVGQGQGADDSVVYFPDLKVVAIGDLAAGPSSPARLAALDKVLTLDFDVAVPNTGPKLTRDELTRVRDQSQAMTSDAATTASR